MEAVYHVRIKKDYAEAVIRDLEQMEAIELVEEGDSSDIAARQQQESLRRLAEYKADPSIGIPWEDVLAELKAEEDGAAL